MSNEARETNLLADVIAEQLKILAACAGENLPDFDLKALLDQASEMRTGIHSLAEGSASLESGIAAFHDAAGQMENGMKSLQEGSAQVSSGGIALKDGYAIFSRAEPTTTPRKCQPSI